MQKCHIKSAREHHEVVGSTNRQQNTQNTESSSVLNFEPSGGNYFGDLAIDVASRVFSLMTLVLSKDRERGREREREKKREIDRERETDRERD